MLFQRLSTSFFVPNQRTKSSKRSSNGGGGKSRCPYTSLYLSCLKIGLTVADLKYMTLSRAIFLVDTYNATYGAANTKTDTVREATQEDIQSFFGG